MVRLLLAGFPCTTFSCAKRGRETDLGGKGGELFKNALIAREKFRPDLFLLENVASMHRDVRGAVSEALGAGCQEIDAALVSAQRRKRLYWHNFGDVPQPEDRGITLQDVLEGGEAFGVRDGNWKWE